MELTMTPEQRLDRAEKILGRMIKSGRRSRSKFHFKINSLIDAQMRHEARWDAESQVINEKMKELIQTQKETSEQMKRQAARADQETADLKKSLQAFIDSL